MRVQASSLRDLSLSIAQRGGQGILVLAILFLAYVLPSSLSVGTKMLVERYYWVEHSFLFVPTRALENLDLPLRVDKPANSAAGSQVTCDVAVLAANDPEHFGQFIAEAHGPVVRCIFNYPNNTYAQFAAIQSGRTEHDFLVDTFVLPGTKQGRLLASVSRKVEYFKYNPIPPNWMGLVLYTIAGLSVWLAWRIVAQPLPDQGNSMRLDGQWWTITLALLPAVFVPIEISIWSMLNASGQSVGVAPVDYFVRSLFVAPVVEESIYRAWLISALIAAGASRPWAIMLGAMVFSLAHNHSLLDTYFSYLIGIALGFLWIQRRSLLLCILSHSLVNLVSVPLRI